VEAWSTTPFKSTVHALKDGDDEEKVCTEYDALPDEGQVARPKAYLGQRGHAFFLVERLSMEVLIKMNSPGPVNCGAQGSQVKQHTPPSKAKRRE
jgi:hypothetical protein